MKICNWKRFLTFLAIVLFLIVAIIFAIKTNTSEEYEVIETYAVQYGDTLWTICEKYRPKHMDIREYIYLIAQTNNISNCLIYPGQEIQILGIKEV